MSSPASMMDTILADREAIVFRNPGLIDLMALSTFGMSVKVGNNPIGRFGTGLKYAIAVLLRNQQKVTIWRGQERFDFDSVLHSSRGKDFQIVTMNGERLPFMLDLGPDWELWMAFRELWCNCVDEAGDIRWSDSPGPQNDATTIAVYGAEFGSVYQLRDKYVLSSTPMFSIGGVDVHEGSSDTIFYRGIAVQQFQNKTRSIFTYNITTEIDLTEDRTVKYDFEPKQKIGEAIAATDRVEFIETCLAGGGDTFEGKIDFSYVYSKPAETFVTTARAMTAKKDSKLNPSARTYVEKHEPEKAAAVWTRVDLDSAEQAMWDDVNVMMRVIGFDLDSWSFDFYERLGIGIYMEANGGRFMISRDAFENGRKDLMQILLRGIMEAESERASDVADYYAEEVLRIGTAAYRWRF